MKDVGVVEMRVDLEAALDRLAAAIRLPTISNQDRADFDTDAYDRLHRLLSDISTSIDPSPVSSPDGPEYELLEKTIRQTWGSSDLLVAPYLVIGGTDSKYVAASIAGSVFRFSPVRVESAADTARWHGVNERLLVAEYGRTVSFFFSLIANAEELAIDHARVH